MDTRMRMTIPAGALGSFDHIPVVDFSPLLDKRPGALASLSRAVMAACSNTGFMYVEGHGVPEELLAEVFAEARGFFSLPAEAKRALDIRRSPCMRGYFGVGEEKPEYEALGDLKEGFDMALDLDAMDPDVRAGTPLHGPNAWPEGLPVFRRVMTRYHDEMRRVGGMLLRAFARGLGMPDHWFESHFKKPLAQLRLLHYPPQVGPVSRRQMGAGEHTDFGCLTILSQDDVGGLEAQNSAGDWVPVPPRKGAFVVNIGDLMTRWTNDLLPATVHRVINSSGRDRSSVVFFLDPDWHAEIASLASCCGPDRPPRYATTTGGAYMQSKLDATFPFRTAEPSHASATRENP